MLQLQRRHDLVGGSQLETSEIVSEPNKPAPDVFEMARPSLIGFLMRTLRRNDVRVATVTDDTLQLTLASKTVAISHRDIETVTKEAHRKGIHVRIRHTQGTALIRAIAPEKANDFLDVLEIRRANWWKEAIALRIDALSAVQNQLNQLRKPNRYVTQSAILDLERSASAAVDQIPNRWPDALSMDPSFRTLAAILLFLDAPHEFRDRANEAFISSEFEIHRELFDRIESRPLSEQQRKAVVTDGDRNLVVAAAGSGKTSVIVAKAAWLVERGSRKPSELLLLAFARDAQREMEIRIRQRLEYRAAQGITVRTFHSLGLAIIANVEGRKPALARSAESDRALFDLLKAIVRRLIADGKLSKPFLLWFQDQFAPYRSEHEFRNWGEYYDYIRDHDIRSLKGDTVKSFEECEIANFLYIHGVPYEYEAPYEHDTATREHRQYKPDFYLPGPGIYIEHFGIDANGNPAPFVDREKYLSGIEWKRELHREKGTILVETYSHERASDCLIRNLRAKLEKHGVTFSVIPKSQFFSSLEKQERTDPFVRLVATFLQHFKGARMSFGDISERAKDFGERARADAFLSVFRPINEQYEKTLSDAKEVDFHDMINMAADHVESGRFQNPFGYVLVDEFQDISPGRARLLKALLDQSPENQLLAVGDDWQAIYRFGGSDVAIMSNFESRFGDFERIDLETTFRCADRVADPATAFVLKNSGQIKKSVQAIHRANGPAVLVGLSDDGRRSALEESIARIADHAVGHEGQSTVLILGRYRRSLPRGFTGVDRQHPHVRISAMTIHGSKGLEADYVVVPGLCSGKYGFPSEIVDDPLLELVLSAPETFPHAEERRLLYVAMTRARRQVYLLADGGSPSSFVQELIGEAYDVEVFGRLPEAPLACPTCKTGQLQRRENSRTKRAFYGCSNWPLCEYSRQPCTKCGEGFIVRDDGGIRCRDCNQEFEACATCNGWLEPRMGKFGRFLGCSNYPECSYTRNIAKPRRRRRR